MKNEFKLCPECGSKKVEWKGRKWVCPNCGMDLYCNVAAAVGIVLTDKNHNVLFEVRAKEPRKGYLALPGGFIDYDERAEDAIIRECKEEIGADITKMKFICTYPNTYEYKKFEYKTCDMFFEAEIPEDFSSMEEFVETLKNQESEVTGFKICKIDSAEDVDNLPIAFESTRKTLKDWLLK